MYAKYTTLRVDPSFKESKQRLIEFYWSGQYINSTITIIAPIRKIHMQNEELASVPTQAIYIYIQNLL